MKQQHALGLAVAAGVLALATVGLLGYRLLSHSSLPAGDAIPPGLLSSSWQVTHEEGQAAADVLGTLTLDDLEGRPQALAQWRGKVLVVNFWASWCAPCIEEMPAFSRLHRHYAAYGVQFVGIGMDEAEKMRAFVETTPVAYPLLVAGPAGSRTPGLEVKGLPYTLVIDRDGRLETNRLGRLDEATLEPTLRRLLGM